MQEEDEDSDGYVNDQMLEEVEPKILFYQRSYCTVEDAMQFLQYKGLLMKAVFQQRWGRSYFAED